MARLRFRHRVGLKIVSIALAFLIWLVVSGEQTVERSFRIPLEFSNLPAELEIVGEPPSSVDVRVKGSSGLVSRLGAVDLSAVIDLQGGKSGRRLFPLSGAQVRAPFGLEVVQVTPSTIAVTIEPSASKMVPIVPVVDGEPAAGFVVGAVSAQPATVELVGPASVLRDVTEAVTEPVSVEAASAGVTEDVTVGPPDVNVRLRVPLRARVSVSVVHAPAEWAVAGIPVRVVGGTKAEQTTPPTVTVQLRAPREAVTSAVKDFDATVNVTGLGPGDLLLPVRIVAPERVGVIKVEPAELRVRVK
ncbi:MAG: CdaR family protein [Vicinamibacterales bacterium]